MKPVLRRQFLKSISSSLLLAQAPFILRAAEGTQLTTALIGSGWWGKNILNEAIASGRCTISALCDVDANMLEVTADQVEAKTGSRPKIYADYRELLQKEKPRIAIVASPDHWHALHSIAALDAGANVFVEKPTGHTVNESKAMLKAARASGAAVQVGLHRRIGPHHVSAMKFLRSGAVGDVGMVRLFAHNNGGKESPAPNSPPPEGMNWDFWCGPAPLRPFNNKLHPGGWRNFLDFANGTLGDWGVHWLDQVLWWSEEKYPRKIFCTGGRPVAGQPVQNDREQTTDAPDHQTAIYEFENFTCIWEHRKFAGNNSEKHKIGAYYYGSKGVLHVGWRDGWTFYPSDGRDPVQHENSQLQEPDGHNLTLLWADFLKAIDEKRQPVASIERAHRSSVLPLLGMISWKVGRSIEWDGANETIKNDQAASALLSRPYRAPWKYPEV